MASNDTANYFRAVLGQGLGMGWGDEAEAWLRSKLPGGSPYSEELSRLNKEYGEFAQRNPATSTMAEVAGGVLPMAASYLIPGGQVAAPATTARTAGALARIASSPYARGAAIGATTGTISGAGSAQPDDRAPGAVAGGLLGTGVGAAAPAVLRSLGATGRWLRDRALPTEETVTTRATGKVNKALEEAGLTPADVEARVLADRARGIPSTVANVDPALVDLAETVAQRSGPSAREVEKTLGRQSAGTRERTYAQTRAGLQPGNYYDDLKQLQIDMRTKADPLYKQAYAYGEVDDPEVLKFLNLPQFQQGVKRAEKLLKAEGREMDLYREVVDPNTGAKTKQFIPTVEALDQVKRGLDDLIEKETDPVTGKVTQLGRVYVKKKNEFLDSLDAAVPDYAAARAVYRGDAELADAMRSGMNDFRRMDHEEVIKMIGGMSDAEKNAFKTGVVRNIYSTIMDPSGNINAAQRVIGSPETAAKLQPLFDSPSQFSLFKSALEREAQLFQQSNRILGGAATGRRTQARERFEEGPGVGAMVGDAITGGFMGSLTNLAARVARSATMTDDVAEKVAKMLMSSEPAEVAAAVRLLETYSEKAARSASNLSKGEAGVIMGTTISAQPAPSGEEGSILEDIADSREAQSGAMTGPDIEADIARDFEKRKGK
jgi:hypothetical protein